MMEFLLVFARRKFLLFDEVPIEMMISNDLQLFSFFFCRQEQLPVWWFFCAVCYNWSSFEMHCNDSNNHWRCLTLKIEQIILRKGHVQWFSLKGVVGLLLARGVLNRNETAVCWVLAWRNWKNPENFLWCESLLKYHGCLTTISGLRKIKQEIENKILKKN